MKLYLTALSATALALLGSVAMADGINYLSYGAGYTHYVPEGPASNLDVASVGGSIEYETGPWILTGSLIYQNYDDGSTPRDVTFLDGTVAYEVSPSFFAVLGYNDLVINGGGDNGIWRLGGEYHTGAYRLGLGYSAANDGNYSAATAYVGYAPSEQTQVAGALTIDDDGDARLLVFGDYETGPWTFDGSTLHFFDRGSTYYDLKADYAFAGNFRASGNLSGFLQGGAEITRIGLGGGYEIRNDLWVELTAARYIQPGSAPEVNEIGISITFETGGHRLITDDTADIERQLRASLIGQAS